MAIWKREAIFDEKQGGLLSMEREVFDDFLQNQYLPTLEHNEKRAAYNRLFYQYLQWSIIVLSGLNALLVGLQTIFEPIFIKIITLIVSILISILAGVFKTFNFQEKWAEYHKRATKLKYEYNMYSAGADAYAQTKDKDKESHFVERVGTLFTEWTNNMPNATIQRSRTFSHKQLSHRIQEHVDRETEQISTFDK